LIVGTDKIFKFYKDGCPESKKIGPIKVEGCEE
jgi:hypothetical protein